MHSISSYHDDDISHPHDCLPIINNNNNNNIDNNKLINPSIHISSISSTPCTSLPSSPLSSSCPSLLSPSISISSISSSFSPCIDLWFGVEEQCQLKSIYTAYSKSLDIQCKRQRCSRAPLEFIGEIQRTKLTETQLIHSQLSTTMINIIQESHKQQQQLSSTTDSTTIPIDSTSSSAASSSSYPWHPQSLPSSLLFTYDEISIYSRDSVPLGSPMPLLRTCYTCTLWDAQDGIPLHIDQLHSMQTINQYKLIVQTAITIHEQNSHNILPTTNTTIPLSPSSSNSSISSSANSLTSYIYCLPVYCSEGEGVGQYVYCSQLSPIDGELGYAGADHCCIYSSLKQLGRTNRKHCMMSENISGEEPIETDIEIDKEDDDNYYHNLTDEVEKRLSCEDSFNCGNYPSTYNFPITNKCSLDDDILQRSIDIHATVHNLPISPKLQKTATPYPANNNNSYDCSGFSSSSSSAQNSSSQSFAYSCTSSTPAYIPPPATTIYHDSFDCGFDFETPHDNLPTWDQQEELPDEDEDEEEEEEEDDDDNASDGNDSDDAKSDVSDDSNGNSQHSDSDPIGDHNSTSDASEREQHSPTEEDSAFYSSRNTKNLQQNDKLLNMDYEDCTISNNNLQQQQQQQRNHMVSNGITINNPKKNINNNNNNCNKRDTTLSHSLEEELNLQLASFNKRR